MPIAAAKKFFTYTPLLLLIPEDPYHEPDGGHEHHRASDDTDVHGYWPGS